MNIKSILFSKKVVIVVGFILLIIVVVTPAYYFYSQYQKSQQLLQNPTLAAQEELRILVEKVGRLIELPSGETPTVATVSDKEKLKEQLFFTKSENGDKVLIFTQAKKAILYRPSTNMIIEVAPVNIGPTLEPSPATASAQLKLVKIALYNGTATTGLTKIVEKQLKEDSELGGKIEVVAKENAKKKDYSKTLVVDLSGNQKVLAENIAKVLDGTVSPLPEGESSRPNTDLVVIVGK